MKLVLPALVLILFAVAGGVGGYIAREPLLESDITDKKETEGEIIKFPEQFVVPILKAGELEGMVIMGLALEVDPQHRAELVSREVKLRDTLLRSLFGFANAGHFRGSFTEEKKMASLRQGLLDAIWAEIAGEEVYQVLITDIIRQDS